MIRVSVVSLVAVVSFCGLAALGDLVSAEIRGWLDLVPEGILRLAARRLDKSVRAEIYEEMWLPDLRHALHGAEARPITRLARGVYFAAGLALAASRFNPQTTATRKSAFRGALELDLKPARRGELADRRRELLRLRDLPGGYLLRPQRRRGTLMRAKRPAMPTGRGHGAPPSRDPSLQVSAHAVTAEQLHEDTSLGTSADCEETSRLTAPQH